MSVLLERGAAVEDIVLLAGAAGGVIAQADQRLEGIEVRAGKGLLPLGLHQERLDWPIPRTQLPELLLHAFEPFGAHRRLNGRGLQRYDAAQRPEPEQGQRRSAETAQQHGTDQDLSGEWTAPARPGPPA